MTCSRQTLPSYDEKVLRPPAPSVSVTWCGAAQAAVYSPPAQYFFTTIYSKNYITLLSLIHFFAFNKSEMRFKIERRACLVEYQNVGVQTNFLYQNLGKFRITL